jgi:CRP/FNR family cyclic AMP-dependent transcriptional regulator
MTVDFSAVLEGIWLFSELDRADIDRIARLARPRRYAARATVVQQGDASGELFAVVSGRLKVSTANAAGDEVVLSIHGPGEVFGEIALLDGAPRSATVSALEPCELLLIQRDPFLALLTEVPVLALKLMAMMSRRIRVLTALTEDVSLLDVPKRLAKTLLTLADRFGEPSPAGEVRLTLKLSQQELGSMIGATREMVNRSLRDWVKADTLEISDGQIIVRNPEALARHADGSGGAPGARRAK